ncbi:MAG TPA: cytochrome c maturation protein CcmE [Gammaproteobacteria bacterium]|nr:cytochrome c maturation protein CcmE [Gammaproteobacteria bacterium]
MNPKRRRRLILIVTLVMGVGIAVGLVLNAFRDNLLFFYSPSQIAKGESPQGRNFRVGGLVVKGSVHHERDGLTVHFVLTDYAKSIPVVYKGILPDLFREGQGIVATGRIDSHGEFVAQEVLAKHDSKYMPPEVASALKQARAKDGAADHAPAPTLLKGSGSAPDRTQNGKSL